MYSINYKADLATGPRLERPGSLSGPKRNSRNYDPLAMKICSFNIFQMYRPLVAHLVVHQAVTREVVSSKLRPDQHSGSLNN